MEQFSQGAFSELVHLSFQPYASCDGLCMHYEKPKGTQGSYILVRHCLSRVLSLFHSSSLQLVCVFSVCVCGEVVDLRKAKGSLLPLGIRAGAMPKKEKAVMDSSTFQRKDGERNKEAERGNRSRKKKEA